jgi:hypothetical protein
MRLAAGLVLALLLLASGCGSIDEVARVTSPDGRVDAVLTESDCGAPCSLGYEVRLELKGHHDVVKVASLDGATRNENAWGVNLKWVDDDNLSIEYLRANFAYLLKQTVDIGGHTVKLSLRGGVKDPRAPAGAMWYNLH